MSEELLPADIGTDLGGCFETYVAGECLTTKEAFARHPVLMTASVIRNIWPALLPILVIAWLLAYRFWRKRLLKNAKTHATEAS